MKSIKYKVNMIPTRITCVSNGQHFPVDKECVPGLEKSCKHIKLKYWYLQK